MLLKLFPEKMNKLNVLSTSTLKMVDFDDDKLTGVMVLANKMLRVMSVYSVAFECSRINEESPYKVSI